MGHQRAAWGSRRDTPTRDTSETPCTDSGLEIEHAIILSIYLLVAILRTAKLHWISSKVK